MLTNTDDSAQDNREHNDLNTEQRRCKSGIARNGRDVEPSGQHHQDQPGQHETKPGKQPANPPARDHAEMDAQLMRFGARQDLHDSEQVIEPRGVDPALLFNERLPQHGDLRDRPTKSQRAKPQEFRKQRDQ